MIVTESVTETAATDAAPAPSSGTREVSRVQIFKQVAKDRLLDIGDMLSLDPRRHKIAVSLVEFDADYRAVSKVRHYVDVADAKLVCHDILTGVFTEWADYKGTPARGGGDGADAGLQARVLTIRRDPKYRQPYVIKVDNGVGEQLPGGAVKMAQTTESLTILLSDWDARKMALAVLDYIRDWETINFRKRQEAQTHLVTLPGADGTGDGEGAVATAALSKNRYARAAAN